jgi:hypothetical protein
VQLYRYFVSQSSEFCLHNPLYCFSTSNTKGKRIFRYCLSPETFGYTLCVCIRVCVCGGGLKHNFWLKKWRWHWKLFRNRSSKNVSNSDSITGLSAKLLPRGVLQRWLHSVSFKYPSLLTIKSLLELHSHTLNISVLHGHYMMLKNQEGDGPAAALRFSFQRHTWDPLSVQSDGH